MGFDGEIVGTRVVGCIDGEIVGKVGLIVGNIVGRVGCNVGLPVGLAGTH